MNALTTSMTMTSREIAELTGKELAHVHRDIRAMLDELKKDDPNLDHPHEDKDARGYTTCFHLNRELTETLLTGYSASARIKVIRRWHDLEEQAAKPADPMAILNDPAAMRGILLTYTEKVIALESAVQILAPKADAFDLVSASKDAMTITEASKVLGVKRSELTAYMHAKGWIYRQNGSWVAYDQHIRSGCLQYKEATYTDDKTGMECHKPYCHVTQKGMSKLALMLRSPEMELAAAV